MGEPDTSERLRDLLERLDLEPAGPDAFLGRSEYDRHGRIYGGQVAAQAVVAAARTVPGTPVHSVHAYFLRPGDPREPIHFRVERTRDGRSFATRRVVAQQRERAIFETLLSFHAPEPGFEHAPPMPEAPEPESLVRQEERAFLNRERIPEATKPWAHQTRAVDMRHTIVPAFLGGEPGDAPNLAWFRTDGPLPDDPLVHQALIVYASDMAFNDNAMRRHGARDSRAMMASIDHAIWLHRPARADGWLLYWQESPTASGGRGFVRGTIFARDGTFVASVAQEALLRPWQERR